MTTVSPFYPAKPWPVANLRNHPAFILMMKSKDKKPAYYELHRVAADPDRYGDGITLFDFADECASMDTCDDAIRELTRMNVFRLEAEGEAPRLVPCTKLEADEIKVGRKATCVYLRSDLTEAIRVLAVKNHTSMSRLIETAISTYLGEPEPAA